MSGIEELQKLLKAKKAPTVIILHGPEEWLRRRAVEHVEAAYKDLMVLRLSGENLDWSRVADEILTASLFSKNKLVIVDESESFAKQFSKELSAYFENPSKQNILVMVSPSTKPPVLEHRNVLHVLCEAQPGYEFERLIDGAVRDAGKLIEPAAARELTRRLGEGRSQWQSQVAKLVDFAGTRASITLADVETQIRDEQEFQAFDLVNAISAGQRDKALGILHRLLAQGAAAPMLMGSLVWQYRKMAEVKRKIQKGMSGERACSSAGVRFRPQDFARMVDQTPEERILKGHQELMQVDLSLKSTGQPEDLLLDRLVIELTRG